MGVCLRNSVHLEVRGPFYVRRTLGRRYRVNIALGKQKQKNNSRSSLGQKAKCAWLTIRRIAIKIPTYLCVCVCSQQAPQPLRELLQPAGDLREPVQSKRGQQPLQQRLQLALLHAQQGARRQAAADARQRRYQRRKPKRRAVFAVWI